MNVVLQSKYAQALFDNKIVPDLGRPTSDSTVNTVVLNTVHQLLGPATNIPAGAEQAAVPVDHKADAKSALADVTSLFAKQAAGSISLVLLGETHRNAADETRAGQFLTAIGTHALTPTVVVFERALSYAKPTGVELVTEEKLSSATSAIPTVDFGINLSPAQRSMVVAGYLVLCLAGGNQQSIDKVLLFYGAEHADVFKFFDYYARQAGGGYLLKRPRTFMSIRSSQA